MIRLFLVACALAASLSGQTPSPATAARLNGVRSGSLIGNGVDAGTGAFQLTHNLLTLQGGRSLDFTASYESLFADTAGSLGLGWSHPFEVSIGGNPTGTVTVRWNAYRLNSFAFTSTGNNYRPLEEAVQYDRLTRNANGSWRLVRQDGTIFEFESSGRLRRIGNKLFQFVEMVYDAGGRLTGVREPIANRQLSLTYQTTGGGLVESIRDAADRTVFFEYDTNGRLTASRAPVTLGDVITTFTFDPRPIPDNSASGVTTTFEISRTAPIGLVKLGGTSITHQRPSDLRIYFTSPQGTRLEAPTPTPTNNGTVLNFEGMILGAFEGENPRGTWRVQVVDTRAGSTGQLNGWNFIFSDPSDPVRYTYDAAGGLTTATDPSGRRMYSNRYDILRRVSSQDDGIDTNAIATFTYQAGAGGGARTTYRDRLGNAHVFEHDADSRLLSYTDPLRNTVAYAYNGRGDRIRVTDPLGRITIFGYDGDGNMTTAVDPAGGVLTFDHDSNNNLTRVRDPLGRSTTFNYNNSNNLTRVTDARGNSDTKTYSANSQITGLLLEDGAGINYTYAGGMPVGVSHPDGHGIARSEFDEIGRPTRSVDRLGGATEYTYDARGNVLTERDPLGQTQSSSYDNLGRPYVQIDRTGSATFTAYDANGNRSRITDALGNVTRLEYDGEDRLIRTVDANGNESRFAYDAAGRLVSETDALGNARTSEYDAGGQLVAMRDATGTVVLRQRFGLNGSVEAEIDALGNTWTTSYDSMSRPVTYRDPLNQTLAWTYDNLDRPVAVRDPAGRTLEQEFLEDDVLSTMTDGRGNKTSFGYGPANRLTSITPPSGQGTRLSYDGRDRVTSETLPGGATVGYTYDARGRISEMTRSGGGLNGPNVGYSYDGNSNVTRVVDRSSSAPALVYTYDRLNRVTSYTSSSGETIRYGYDSVNNLTTLTYPDGRQVSYTYDKADRLIQVRDWAGRLTRYTYDRRDLITRIDFPNGTFRVMFYDAASRLVRRADMTAQGGVIVEYGYGYNRAGNLTSVQPSRFSGGSPTAATMAFDSNNRATSFNGSSVSYDVRGNLARGPLGSSFANFTFDLANRLTAAGGVTYSYDQEDRLIGYSGPGGTVRLSVNPRSKPSSVIVKSDQGGATRYVYGVGLIYEETGGGVRVFHYDHRGNTVAFSDASGTITGTLDYGPYGEILAQSGSTDSLFKFGGLFGVITDPNGLNSMRYRWYSPALRRFLSQDAHAGDINSPATLNRYSYAANNPLNFVDPEGQFFNAIAAAVGAVAGVAVALIARGIERAATGRSFVEKGEEWAFAGELAGAAIGGGIAGACLGACSVGALAAYGAVGGLAGNLVKQGIGIGGTAAFGGDPQYLEFNAGDLVADTVLGGAFGALPIGKGAKALTGRLKDKALKQAAKRSGAGLILMESGGVIGEVGVKGAAAKGALLSLAHGGAFLGDIALGLVQSALVSVSGRGLNQLSPAAPGGETQDNRTVEASARQSIYQGKKARYGEFVHWNAYHRALAAAARPQPNVPQSLLATF